MPAICLPKINREELLNALKKDEITIEKLYKLSEADRRAVLEKYTGKELSSFVNAKFEQAMLSNQKAAFANWIKRTTSFTDPIRKDMLKKVDKVKKFLESDAEKGFMEDLAEMKLGVKVSEMEAKTLLEMKDKIDDFKTKIPENSPRDSAERMAYGYAVDDFKQFIGERKLGAESIKFKERFLPENLWRNIVDVANTTKSLVATLDNSFIGRQGIKTLLDGKYGIWANTVKESFSNIAKELFTKGKGMFESRDDAVMRTIRARIYSDPNALNGKYNAAKNGYGLGILHEEVFPTSIPERILLFGRVFKAAETAFNGSALTMRHKLANAIIENAEKNGIDMLDQREASARGKRVSSMTGRGDIILAPKGAFSAESINALMFSIRFLKSNFDTLTAHTFDREFTRSARIESAKSTMRIAASTMAILSVADMLGFDVEPDPRSSRAGQICYKNHCYDVTGGMRGLVTLGSRIFPTMHNGEWGFWTKSATTGKWTKMSSGNFGEQTALDTFESFFEGKLSPSAGMIRDIWKGQKFSGEKPNFVNSTLGLIVPVSADMLIDELKKGNDDILLAMIAEGLGISATETTMRGYGAKWEKLKGKVDTEVYNESLKLVTDRFNERAGKLENSFRWQRMDNDERTKELDKIRREETERIFSRYGIK